MSALRALIMVLFSVGYLAKGVWVYFDAQKRRMDAWPCAEMVWYWPLVGLAMYAQASGSRTAWWILAAETVGIGVFVSALTTPGVRG